MGDDGDIEEFKGGSKSGNKKINQMRKRVNAHEKLFLKMKKMGPYLVIFCVDNEPQLFEIMARKTDGSDDPAELVT